jgi:hypothetical protein
MQVSLGVTEHGIEVGVQIIGGGQLAHHLRRAPWPTMGLLRCASGQPTPAGVTLDRQPKLATVDRAPDRGVHLIDDTLLVVELAVGVGIIVFIAGRRGGGPGL